MANITIQDVQVQDIASNVVEAGTLFSTTGKLSPFFDGGGNSFAAVDLGELLTAIQSSIITYINQHATIQSDGSGGYILTIE